MIPPRPQECQPRPHPSHQVVVLTTGERQRGSELCVDQADESHDGTADEEGDDGAARSRVLDPAAGQHDPAEADHGAEAEAEDSEVAE